VRNRDCRANVSGKNFWAVPVFCQKKIRETNFDRKIFGIFRFQSKKFWAGQLSTGIFLGFPTYEPEKNPENSDHGRSNRDRSTTWMWVNYLTNTFFSRFRTNFFSNFQLSIQKFSGFSNFEPKIFPPVNFQSEKMWAKKISVWACRARSVVQNFIPDHTLRQWRGYWKGGFPCFVGIVRKLLGYRNFRAQNKPTIRIFTHKNIWHYRKKCRHSLMQ
jgi:hypothetical protein